MLFDRRYAIPVAATGDLPGACGAPVPAATEPMV